MDSQLPVATDEETEPPAKQRRVPKSGQRHGAAERAEVGPRCEVSPEPIVASRSWAGALAHAAVPEVPCDGGTAVRNVAPGRRRLEIDNFPDEIMLNIFLFLSFDELVDVTQKVCLRWKRLAHDPVLWHDKEYFIRWNDDEYFTRFLSREGYRPEEYPRLKKCRSCQKINFSECIHCRVDETKEAILQTASLVPQLRTLIMERHVDDHIIREICRNCPHLTTLRIDGTQYVNQSLFEYIVENCPEIHTLIIANNLMDDPWYAKKVSSLEHLRILELFYNKVLVGPLELRILADGCPQLQEIKIADDTGPLEPRYMSGVRGILYYLEDMEYFLNAKKDRLTSVSLRWAMTEDRCQRGDRCLPFSRCIFPLLTVCASSLKKLKIDRYDVYPEFEEEAFAALRQLHNLRELYLQNLDEGPPDLTSLPFKPGDLPQLQRLCLRQTPCLRNDTVLHISECFTTLRELRICLGFIKDKALSKINCLKHLEILDLSGCRELRGGAIAHIAQLPALHTLILQEIQDLSVLQPSLRCILDMEGLRFLDFLNSGNVGVVPFIKFPSRLVNLRMLHYSYEWDKRVFYSKKFAGLQRQMPQLKIFSAAYIPPRKIDNFYYRNL